MLVYLCKFLIIVVLLQLLNRKKVYMSGLDYISKLNMVNIFEIRGALNMILLVKVNDFFMQRRLGKIENRLWVAGLQEQAKQLNGDFKDVLDGGFKSILACVDDIILFNDKEIYAGFESYVTSRIRAFQYDYLERFNLTDKRCYRFKTQPFVRYMLRYDGRVIGYFMLINLFVFVTTFCLGMLFDGLALPVMFAGCVFGLLAALRLLKLMSVIYFGMDDLLKIRDILFFQAFREYFADLQKNMLFWLEKICKKNFIDLR